MEMKSSREQLLEMLDEGKERFVEYIRTSSGDEIIRMLKRAVNYVPDDEVLRGISNMYEFIINK